jgi:hypothetical protein
LLTRCSVVRGSRVFTKMPPLGDVSEAICHNMDSCHSGSRGREGK